MGDSFKDPYEALRGTFDIFIHRLSLFYKIIKGAVGAKLSSPMQSNSQIQSGYFL